LHSVVPIALGITEITAEGVPNGVLLAIVRNETENFGRGGTVVRT